MKDASALQIKIREGEPQAVSHFNTVIYGDMLPLISLLRLREVSRDFRSYIDKFLSESSLGRWLLWNYGAHALFYPHTSSGKTRFDRFHARFNSAVFSSVNVKAEDIYRRLLGGLLARDKTVFVGDANQFFDHMLLLIPHPRQMTRFVKACQFLKMDCDDDVFQSLTDAKKCVFQFLVLGRTETREHKDLHQALLDNLARGPRDEKAEVLSAVALIFQEEKYLDKKYDAVRALINPSIDGSFHPGLVLQRENVTVPFYVKFLQSSASTVRKWSNVQLSSVDLSGLQWVGSKFVQGCGLNDLIFSSCEFTHVRFTDVDMRGANFQNSRGKAEFHHVQLQDSDFRDADLRYMTFASTDVSGSDFTYARINIGTFLTISPLTRFTTFQGIREDALISDKLLEVILKRDDLFRFSNLIFCIDPDFFDNISEHLRAVLRVKAHDSLKQLLESASTPKEILDLWYSVYRGLSLTTLFDKPGALLASVELFVHAFERVVKKPYLENMSFLEKELLSMIRPRCTKSSMSFYSMNDAWDALRVRVENAVVQRAALMNPLRNK